MQVRNILKTCLLMLSSVCMFQNICQASLTEVLYDNFDDGNYDGWTVSSYFYPFFQAPVVAPSPDGYAIWGIGGYGDSDGAITKPISLDDAKEICIEVRAKSASVLPNHPTVYLGNGYMSTSSAYYVRDYGKARGEAQWFWFVREDGQLDEGQWIYDVDNDIIYNWHTFKWCRNADGWWSLAIYDDDSKPPVVEVQNFTQDLQITSFEWVEIRVFGTESAVEWVRISADFPPVADAGPDQTAYAWIDGIAEVTLDGSGSNDPDGDTLTYSWTWDGGSASGVSPTIELPVGEHTIELVVNDGTEDSESDEVVITVIEPMQAQLWIFPQIIRRHRGFPEMTALVRLPEGVTKDQLDMDQPLLLYPGGIEATCQAAIQWCSWGTPRTSIIAFFNKADLMDAVPDNGCVELYVVGQLGTGRYFYGSDTVRIFGR